MMELADVTDSKSVDGDIVWVRVPLPAPKKQPLERGVVFLKLRLGLEKEGAKRKKTVRGTVFADAGV